VVTFWNAHWAELIQPQRWAGVKACPPRNQGKAKQGKVRFVKKRFITKIADALKQ